MNSDRGFEPDPGPVVMLPNLLARILSRARGPGSELRILGFGVPDVVVGHDELLYRAAWLGQKIPAMPHGQPATLVIAAQSPLAIMIAFFAGLWTGARPLILPHPAALGGRQPFLHRLEHTAAGFPGRCVLALEEGVVPDHVRLPDVPVIPLPTALAEYGTDALAQPPAVRADDIAFLQVTSASTGENKMVGISHANVCANLTAIGAALDLGPGDRMASWLPLYHDMGLVGTTLASFFHGLDLVMMRPAEFLLRPQRWLDALSRFRCAATAAPNFGYDYARQSIPDRDLRGCDLSALRHAMIGAEPIRPTSLQAFHDRFRRFNFRSEGFTSCYGMAESTLGVSMVRPDQQPHYLLVDPARTTVGGPVRILGHGTVDGEIGGSAGVAVMSVGRPLAGIDVRLVDDHGLDVVGDRRLGEITVAGPSLSVGYVEHTTGRPVPFPGGLHRTGDLGFFDRSELYVVDRRQQVITRNGRQFMASLIEQQAARILTRSAQEVLVLGVGGGDVALIVENCSEGQPQLTADQVAGIRALDLAIDEVVFARKRVIPRTTSGKKRYAEARDRLADRSLRIDHVLRLPAAGH